MSNEYTTQYGSGVGNVNETGTGQHGHGQQKGGLMKGLKEGMQKVKENVSGNKGKHDDVDSSADAYGSDGRQTNLNYTTGGLAGGNTYGTNAPAGGGVVGGTTPAYGAEGQQAYGTGNTATQGGYSSGMTGTGTGTQGAAAYPSGLAGTGTGGVGGYNSSNTGNINETGHHGRGQEKGGLMQGLKEGAQKVKENVSSNKGKHDDYNTSANTYGTNAPLGGGVVGSTPGYGAEGQQAYATGPTGTQGYSSGLTGAGTGTQGAAAYPSGLAGTGTGGVGGYNSSNTGNINETGHHGHGQEKGGLMQGLKEGAQKVKENVSSNKGKHDDYNTSASTYGTNAPLGGGVVGSTPGYGTEGQQAYATGTTGAQGYPSGVTGAGTQGGGYASGLAGTGAGGVAGYNSSDTGNVNETGHHGHGQEKGGLMQGLKEGAQKVKENVSSNKGKHDDYNTSTNTYGTNAGYGAEGQQTYATGATGAQGGYPSGLTGTGGVGGLAGGVGQGYPAGQEYPSDNLQAQNAGLSGLSGQGGLSNQGRGQRSEY